MKPPRIPMAQEGYPFLLFAALATLTLALVELTCPAILALILTGFIAWFFRDPDRISPMDRKAIVCPADGKVIRIDEMHDDRFLHERVVRVSIFMNVFNVHVNRVPINGTVEEILFKPGRFYAADKDQAALQNEYCAMTMATASGQRYAVVQIAGLIARRIVCYAERGDSLRAGERYGLIRFGSRVDLYLPASARITVAIGDKVSAGTSVLGHLQ